MPAFTGNKVTFSGAGIETAKGVTSQTANTSYYSLSVKFTDLIAVTATARGFCIGFIADNSTFSGAALWLKKQMYLSSIMLLMPRQLLRTRFFMLQIKQFIKPI